MHDLTGRYSSLALAMASAMLLAGCGTFDNVSQRAAGLFTPYRIEIVQGNFVSREQVEALKSGMSRQQVREILGTPMVTSLFHADRWDYVFTLRRQGVETQRRALAVYFSGDTMIKAEGDVMPSEAEFVAALDKRRTGKVPPLEATEEQLRAFDGKRGAPRPDPAAEVSATLPPAPATYPPLEAPAR